MTTLSMSDFPTTTITYEPDPLLVVYINYHRAETPVCYEYDGNYGSTPFQTADMSGNEQIDAGRVNDWLDGQESWRSGDESDQQ